MNIKSYRFAAVAAVLLTLCLVFMMPVGADTIYVGSLGSDQETLEAALDVAQAGDTIIMRAGNHYKTTEGDVEISKNDLTIKGEGSDTTFFHINQQSATQSRGFRITADNVIFEKFKIINDYVIYPTNNNVINPYGNNFTLNDCIVEISTDMAYGYIIDADGAGNKKITITDNKFIYKGSTNMWTVYAGHYSAEHSNLLTFTGNEITGKFISGLDQITGNYVISNNKFYLENDSDKGLPYGIGILDNGLVANTDMTRTISGNEFGENVVSAVVVGPISSSGTEETPTAVTMQEDKYPQISDNILKNQNGALLEVSLSRIQNLYAYFAEIPVISVGTGKTVYSYGEHGKETYVLLGEFEEGVTPLVPGVNLPGSTWTGDAENGYTLAISEPGSYKLTGSFKLASGITFGNNVNEFTLDGSDYTISQAESCTNTIALLDVPAQIGVINLNNVIFDGIKGGAVIRTVGNDINIDNCVFQNCEHTVGQGLLRLALGSATITNSKFIGNSCTMVLTFNFDGAEESNEFVVNNCQFEYNTCAGTAVVYYVDGAGSKITNSKFIGNTVNCDKNGATVYLGFTENNVVTGNLFKDNVVTDSSDSTRVAGGIFFGYEAKVSGNAFIGNSASNVNKDALGQDVCTSTYYECTIDLSDNYFDGEKPVEGEEYFIQHKTGDGQFVLSTYYTKYELDADGNVVLSGKVAGKDYSYDDIAANVAKIGFDSVKVGYSAVDAKEVTVTNGGNAQVNIAASTTSDNYKVTVSSGVVSESGTATITIQPETGLPVGNYEDTLTITIDGTGKTMTIPVSFLVYQPSSGGSNKPVEEPEEPVVEPEVPTEEPEAGEATVETEVTDGGEVELETPTAGGSAASDEDETKITGVVLPTGTDSEVTFVPVSEQAAPEGKETQTKKVFEINVPTYEKGKAAVIKFTMTVAELAADGKEAADVALWHFDEETGEWTKLVTSYTIVDGVVYFEAITNDFSPFAIVYEDEPVDEPVDEPETPASPAPVLGLITALGAAVVLRRK